DAAGAGRDGQMARVGGAPSRPAGPRGARASDVGMDGIDLDLAIDRVARELTAGDPSALFRGRVLARIESRKEREGFSRAVPVVAALAAILVAVWMGRAAREAPRVLPSLAVAGIDIPLVAERSEVTTAATNTAHDRPAPVRRTTAAAAIPIDASPV